MRKVVNRRAQKGAIIITTCLMLLFLLGFMAFALDFGRLFIVKTELQTAMDSCALSAAQELDSQSTSISRAMSAGATAANLNRVNLQSATWDGKGQLAPDTEMTFYNSGFTSTTDPFAASYVECQHMQPDVRLWLMRAMAAFTGNTGLFPATQNVFARAIAKRGSSQTACPIPVALKAGTSASPPLYGLVPGQWVTIWGNRAPGTGEFGWYNLDGSTNARATKDQLESGVCNTRVGDQLGTPGAKTAVDTVWNYRFGIYKNNVDHTQHRPDLSGYSYRGRDQGGNWTNSQSLTLPGGTTTVYWGAWSGTPNAAVSDATADNFVAKRQSWASFDDTGISVRQGSQITFGDSNQMNGYQVVATPGGDGEHQHLGTGDRRVVTVPVLDDSNRVRDYLCVLMLHPMSGPNDDVKIEIIGPAGSPSSPCTTSGIPGGTAGPLVPVLVR